jgi:CDP-diacylglycerol--glycerol-3-phosphate 3-phosphatidyltransferase
VVGVLAKLGVTPNMLTVAQLLGGVLAGYVIGTGELLAGGILVLLASALDAFDGTLARTTGKVTKFGGVFDSTIDRMFEGVVLGGVLWYYLDRNEDVESLLVFATAIGSLCVSYVRARAEAAGVELYDGIFTRVVRILILVAGLLLGNDALTAVLWLLAVATTLTAFHRVYATWQKFDRGRQ